MTGFPSSALTIVGGPGFRTPNSSAVLGVIPHFTPCLSSPLQYHPERRGQKQAEGRAGGRASIVFAGSRIASREGIRRWTADQASPLVGEGGVG